jgi:hypothetical protein
MLRFPGRDVDASLSWYIEGRKLFFLKVFENSGIAREFGCDVGIERLSQH